MEYQATMRLLHRLLETPEPLWQWLETLEDGADAGYPYQTTDCPLHRMIWSATEGSLTELEVNTLSLRAQADQLDSIVYPLPGWAMDFVGAVDRSAHDGDCLTAREVSTILNEVLYDRGE